MNNNFTYKYSKINNICLCHFMESVSYLFPESADTIFWNEWSKKLCTFSVVYYAIKNDEIIAVICVYQNSDIVYIPFLACKETYHGTGISNNLMKYFLEIIDKEKSIIRLEVRKENKRAQSYYKRFSFEIISESDDKYLLERRK